VPKRSLMLAGGGVKIAFQAGVLQVWLDEAGIAFDHADAVSAACFNLAMWVQGLSGTQIADNWRNFDPILGVDVNWSQLARFIYAASLFDLDAFRRNIFPAWGLDWEKIRSSGREATFNVYNFSRHELRPLKPQEMTEDFLVAAASLPMWFPPVHIDGDTYIDAVFNTASNLEEAIRRGADELWVIWTTSQRGEWFDGFVGNFFGIFEATTNGGYKQILTRIERNNETITHGGSGEFGRQITVRELRAEVPIHYLLNFNRDRAAEAVNRGVEIARTWCDANGLVRRPGAVYANPTKAPQTGLHFMEVLKGYVGFGATDYHFGFNQGSRENSSLELQLAVDIEDVDQFITTPEHEASIRGTVVCERLGGKLPVVRGTLNLLVDQGDPTQKKVTYRILFSDVGGKPFILSGLKELRDESGEDVSSEPTTVFAKICRGNGSLALEASTEIVAMGIIRVGTLDLLKQLVTFRAEGLTLADRVSTLTRFGAFYFGRLWDVYARHVLPSAPF
jgi:predicted patatin/cPLA2 family phospholipase